MNKIVYNSRDLFYKYPFGAVEEQTDVKFALALPTEISFAQPEMILNVDGNEYSVQMEYSETINNRLIYRCTYTPRFAQTAFYYFAINWNGSRYTVKKEPDGTGYLLGENGRDRYQLTVYKKGYQTPDSIKGGLYYQIFPDRFYSSGVEHKIIPEDRLVRSDWGGTPNFLPDENGEVVNNDYFGGDLKGIEEKLPYIKELGVNVIYLNPIFEAHSNHRYNTADYMKIDPLLGTESDFVSLCGAANNLEIKIILDGVFSHTGSDSVYFNKNRRYSLEGAYNSQQSPYYDWYKFIRFPDLYQSWWGFLTLPEVDEDNPSYIEFICGENGVIRHWLKLGASGFRLDVADELPDEFIEHLRSAVKAEGEENLLVGEVWEDASNKEAYGKLRRYFLGDELDTVMNYPFKDATLDFVVDKDRQKFVNRIYSIVENYPPQALHTAMNSLSTHDTERAITRIMGESCDGKDRVWQSHHHLSKQQYEIGLKKLRVAMVIQYFLPGVPCLYYGDEAGLQGYKDPFNRKCYPWGYENKEMVEFCKKLGKQRQACPGLKMGVLIFLDSPDGILAMKRRDADGCTVVAVNYSNRSVLWEHSLESEGLRYNGKRLRERNIIVHPYEYVIFTS